MIALGPASVSATSLGAGGADSEAGEVELPPQDGGSRAPRSSAASSPPMEKEVRDDDFLLKN